MCVKWKCVNDLRLTTCRYKLSNCSIEIAGVCHSIQTHYEPATQSYSYNEFVDCLQLVSHLNMLWMSQTSRFFAKHTQFQPLWAVLWLCCAAHYSAVFARCRSHFDSVARQSDRIAQQIRIVQQQKPILFNEWFDTENNKTRSADLIKRKERKRNNMNGHNNNNAHIISLNICARYIIISVCVYSWPQSVRCTSVDTTLM